MAEIKLFSLIIPAFNQGYSIIEDIRSIEKVLADGELPHEIIVVNDGSIDDTFSKIRSISPSTKKGKVKILSYQKNQGKGYAVKFGVEHAKGDVIGFIDAGMDINPKAILVMVELLKESDADIVIGSKTHPASKVKYPILRKILSGGYRSINQILFGFSAKDAQVGLKIFKRDVAFDVFKRVKIKGFAFDIESLAIANSLGYRKIIEAPVDVNYKKGSISSANFWIVVAKMLRDTGIVFYRLKIKKDYGKSI